jgi:hypothetical protein
LVTDMTIQMTVLRQEVRHRHPRKLLAHISLPC